MKNEIKKWIDDSWFAFFAWRDLSLAESLYNRGLVGCAYMVLQQANEVLKTTNRFRFLELKEKVSKREKELLKEVDKTFGVSYTG